MNTPEGGVSRWLTEFTTTAKEFSCQVIICPTFLDIPILVKEVEGKFPLVVGAQNISREKEGAFTGEVSAKLVCSWVKYAIIGHSERRTLFGETDDEVRTKIRLCLENGIKPILCVGETLQEKEQGKTKEILARQISQGLEGLDLTDLIIAYEPVWAIGTGLVPTLDDIDEIIKFVRNETNSKFKIVYGGSVNDTNATDILNLSDGVLVGGASLDSRKFARIAKSC